MNRVLIVKVTSLGDIVQAQPVVADLRRAFPAVAVDWAADAAFADVPRWNAGVDRVLCAPLRHFKKTRRAQDLKAIFASIGELRGVYYDAVIDLHGVYKSAIIAFLARSRTRYGYRLADLGEQGAAFAYTRRFARPAELNVLEGLRQTVGDALGYRIESPPEFGLHIPAAHGPRRDAQGDAFALLFHATSGAAKKWTIDHWQCVGRYLIDRGIRVALPWGSPDEHDESIAIAAGIPNAMVLPHMSLLEVAQQIDSSSIVVGADTGFVHLAAALRKPTVMIFTATSKKHYGVNVPGCAVSIGDEGRRPSVREVIDAVDFVWPEMSKQGDLMRPLRSAP
ncbi:MAG TPA: lipopolysaccharide heptosyltransferase I [Trinickia sp.]|uniref:lipopolysaccharide heptosyltransferase I n=1 Tax=Trinickia sp. TaxID=2571163 RepID=UPI002CAC2F9A|nr:lipopolysaccharide heptosyltransferase I [Trinickia sp.]HTI17797.1 lipopolysaccharide heptosyltransferase I [Trinickia sp.]